MATPEPGGCRFCGVDQREHMQRWTRGVSWHVWTQPTQEQIKARMLARRTAAALDRAHNHGERSR